MPTIFFSTRSFYYDKIYLLVYDRTERRHAKVVNFGTSVFVKDCCLLGCKYLASLGSIA